MKILLPLAFIFLIKTIHIECLSCISCTACPDPYVVGSSETTCPASSNYCMRIQALYPGGATIHKGCVTNCTEGTINIFGMGFWRKCCNTNNCNSSTSLTKPANVQLFTQFFFILYACLVIKHIFP